MQHAASDHAVKRVRSRAGVAEKTQRDAHDKADTGETQRDGDV